MDFVALQGDEAKSSNGPELMRCDCNTSSSELGHARRAVKLRWSADFARVVRNLIGAKSSAHYRLIK
jgi:hypothetical protein